MLMPINVIYNIDTGVVEIINNGCATGEVYLYHDGTILNYSPRINSSFQLPINSGVYKIDIVTKKWTAEGIIQF